MPKIREALYGELNTFSNLEIEWKSGEDLQVFFFDETGARTNKVTIKEDLDMAEFIQLCSDNKVNLLTRTEPLNTLEEDTVPLDRLVLGGKEYLLFEKPILRVWALAHAAKIGGTLLTFEEKDDQRAVAKWLENFKELKGAHTAAFHDDALYFWTRKKMLPSRDRGRFPWAKREPKTGDCVELRDGLLYAVGCNLIAQSVVQRKLVKDEGKANNKVKDEL
jgi:hypothetical protein